MKSIGITILASLLCLPSIKAQNWVEMMEDNNTNFYEIQSRFKQYFNGKKREKGDGWKPFKRWEYFMEPRVYPSGKRFDAAIIWKEMAKYKSNQRNAPNQVQGVANWQPMGPTDWTNTTGWNPGLGRINGITVDPVDTSIIYVGAPAGGCWKSTDYGQTWSCLTDTLPVLGVSSIAVDYTNHNTVYIATGDGDASDTYSIGVLKSIDGGATWNTTGLNWTIYQFRRIWKLLMHPLNPDIIYAATNNGIWKTSDGGNNWTNLFSGGFYDIEFKPGDPTTLYITSDQFYKSTDSGLSWTHITNGLPADTLVNRAQIAVSPDQPDWVYFLCGKQSGSQFYGIYRSVNSGNSFVLQTNSPNMFGYASDGSDNSGQSWYDMAITVNPNDATEIYIGGVNVWKSNDAGLTWLIVSHWVHPSSIGYTHADIHFLEAFGKTVYCGSDGGVFRTNNYGGDWSDITTGIQIMQFYRLGNSTQDYNMVIGGAQDNGTNQLKNGSWKHVLGADGMEALVDYTTDQIMFGCIQGGAIRKTMDGGSNWSSVTGTITEYGAWVTPYVMHPTDHNTLFAGYQNVWKTTDGGINWALISTWGSATIKSLAVAPSNPDYIYAANYSDIYMTSDGGSNWSNVTTGLPSNAITYIAVHPDDPQTLWVTLSGFSSGNKVYKSTNGGSSWTNISGSLPNIPANCITVQKNSDENLYLGMDVGVYYRDSTMNDWIPYFDGLPNVIVSELEIQYTAGKVRAATFGRGIWESDTYTPVTVPPIAMFAPDQLTICPGDSVQFINHSINESLNSWVWSFPGGTPNTSTFENPVIHYNTSGIYNVQLSVYNNYGNDTLLKVGMVEVVSATAIDSAITQGFENGWVPYNWELQNPDNDATWSQTSVAGGFGQSVFSAKIDNFNNDLEGDWDALASPVIDMSNTNDATLSFDVAYARYSQTFSDSVAVFSQTSCNGPLTLIYLKGGTDLATAGDNTNAFIPSATEWRKDSVDITALYGEPWVKFFFVNRSGFGNNIYVDNINLTGTGLLQNIEEQMQNNKMFLFPNPFNDEVYLRVDDALTGQVQIRIYNLLGQSIKYLEDVELGKSSYVIQTNDFDPGVYIFRITVDGYTHIRKLIRY